MPKKEESVERSQPSHICDLYGKVGVELNVHMGRKVSVLGVCITGSAAGRALESSVGFCLKGFGLLVYCRFGSRIGGSLGSCGGLGLWFLFRFGLLLRCDRLGLGTFVFGWDLGWEDREDREDGRVGRVGW